jgi:flagellar hook-length control protein FliK
MARRLHTNGRPVGAHPERPAVASVAADPSAIAPPLPPPGRPDAAPPAGPSGAFADLLDAAGPSPPQAQATVPSPAASARPGDGSNPAQSGAAAGKDTASSSATAAGNDKGAGNSKGTKDDKDTVIDGSAGVSPPADVMVVAGLAMPVLPLDPPPAAGGSAPTTGAAQSASYIHATPANDQTAGKATDVTAPSAEAGQVPAGLAAPLPAISPTPATTPASLESGPVRIAPDASPPPASPIAVAAPANTSAPAGAPDPAKTEPAAPPQADGIASAKPLTPTDAQNLGPVAPAIGSMPSATDWQPASPSIAPSDPAPAVPSNQEAKTLAPPAAVISASASPLSALTAVTPLNPAPAAPSSATTQVGDQPAGNAGAYIEADAIPVALSAQAAVKFAAPLRASGDGISQTASDNPPDSADGVGGAPAVANGQPATSAAPSFNLTIAAPHQAAPSEWTSPQRAAAPPDAVPLAAVPIAIATRVEAGERKFEIRLDPPDLGRIEVRLNVDSSGRATSHLVVDRADTLDLLRRDAPALERALQSAGLTTDDGALQFSLRDQSFAGRDQGAPAPVPPIAPAATPDSDLAPIDATLRRYGPPAGLGGGIDIRV